MALTDIIREILGRYLTTKEIRPETGDFLFMRDLISQLCYTSPISGIPSPFLRMERVVAVPIASE